MDVASSERRRLWLSRIGKLVLWLSIFDLLALIAVLILTRVISESWWFSTALVYMPRFPYLLPPLVLLLGSSILHRRSVWINLLALALVTGPIMDLHLPWRVWLESNSGKASLTIVSCNVQRFKPDFPTVLQEISRLNPDVVAFQEAGREKKWMAEHFPDWHTVQYGSFWVGSRYPVRMIETCQTPTRNRTSAMQVEIEAPSGRFLLFNIHQLTPRIALSKLSIENILDGTGPKRVEEEIHLRRQDTRATSDFVVSAAPAAPAIVLGDFNTPTCSNLYQRYWGYLTNAFDQAGIGYGYTASCRPNRYWLDYVPWLRIDHILTTDHWAVTSCRIGTRNGSDHRLVVATVTRKW